MVTFGAIRSRAAGTYDETELDFLRLVLPHLQRSIRVFRQLAELEARASAAEAALARFSSAVVVTDAAGWIGSINEQARALLAEADGLVIKDGRLAATKREDDARLTRLILEAAGGPGARGCRRGGLMCVTRKRRRRPLQLAVTPLRGRPALSHVFSVSIVFSDPDFVAEPPVEVLARLFGLTPREAAVAGLLLEGHSPTAAADIMSIRITTMRTHIQHLFHKTQTTRLPELIALLYRNVV
jgi:DNA-binding CsgD family transcriptional regulator